MTRPPILNPAIPMITTVRGMFLLLFLAALAAPLPAATAPALVWGRQLGTPANDFAGTLAVDAAGNCILAGATSGDIAAKNAGGSDAVVAKFDAAGQAVWTRQFGTAADDGVRAVAVDTAGNVFIAGATGGRLGREQFGRTDGFVAKLDPAGQTVWLEQFGSAGDEEGRAIALDAAGNIYVTGSTTASADGTVLAAPDAFARKFDADGRGVWYRQWGTDGAEDARSIAVGPQGDLFVTGGTAGDLAGHGSAGKMDLFLTKLDPTGAVVWHRQFGTVESEVGMKLLVDGQGRIYLGGSSGGEFAGPQAGQGDAILLRLTPDGELVWKRQFGTARWDGIHGLALTTDGRIVAGGCQNWDQCQAFLREFDADGNEVWQTKVATDQIICGTQIGLDARGNIYQVGGTHGPAFGPYAGKDNDMFVVKLGTDAAGSAGTVAGSQ